MSVTTNSLMVRYGHEKEDVEKVKDIHDLVRDILDQTGFSEIIAETAQMTV